MNREEPDQDSSKPKKSTSIDATLGYEQKPAPIEPSGIPTAADDEIYLLELLKTIWESRKTIYKFIAAGFVLGFLVAFLTPKEYLSSTTLMPEYSTDSQGGASGLLQQYGSLIGLSGAGGYSSGSNAIRVELYPEIVQSLTFHKKLAEHEFYFPDKDTTTNFFDYYLEIKSPGIIGYLLDYTIGLPSKIIGLFSDGNKATRSTDTNDQIISLTRDEMWVINELRSRVNASLNEKSGIVAVSVKMRDPDLAARVAQFTVEELTAYLFEYRTEKVQKGLEFIEEQLAKAQIRFEEAQLNLAEFRDSNQGNLTARALTEEQRLNSEYEVAFNLYNNLTQQFEEAKLKVQEETPIFKVLQPVQVPVNDQTSGVTILIVYILLGAMASISWIFMRKFLANHPFNFD